jgi:hypothetical protein
MGFNSAFKGLIHHAEHVTAHNNARIAGTRRPMTKLLVFHIDHKKVTFRGEPPVFEYGQIMEQVQWHTSAM